MFELLFTRPSAIARYRCAPLLNERLRYLAHCEQTGIGPATLRNIAAHQLNLVGVLDLRDDDSLNARRIAAGVRQWALPEARRSHPLTRRRFFSHAERWLRFPGWLEEPEAVRHTHAREVTAFAAQMSGERGWSDATTEGCCGTVNRFFVWLDERGVDLASVGITMLDEVIARYRARSYSRARGYLYAQHLRAFFQFAEQQGWCTPGLAGGIGLGMILRDAIDDYVAWRRDHGARFLTSAHVLYRFCKRVPYHMDCDAVTERDVGAFLAGNGPLTRYRANKYGALAGFYRYAISRGYATRSPLPPADEEPRAPLKSASAVRRTTCTLLPARQVPVSSLSDTGPEHPESGHTAAGPRRLPGAWRDAWISASITVPIFCFMCRSMMKPV